MTKGNHNNRKQLVSQIQKSKILKYPSDPTPQRRSIIPISSRFASIRVPMALGTADIIRKGTGKISQPAKSLYNCHPLPIYDWFNMIDSLSNRPILILQHKPATAFHLIIILIANCYIQQSYFLSTVFTNNPAKGSKLTINILTCTR